MNKLNTQWQALLQKFDDRNKSEKWVLAAVIIFVLVWLYSQVQLSPMGAEKAALTQQISSSQARLLAMQTRQQLALQSAQDDPDRAANERLRMLQQDQQRTQDAIEKLAGSLVTPHAMTQMLTAVLDTQPGLALVRVANKMPETMRPASQLSATDRDDPMVQVYKHGLVIEMQGDYFSLLTYLTFLENLGEQFFWDQIHFQQDVWPDASIILELHTLSMEEGYVGV